VLVLLLLLLPAAAAGCQLLAEGCNCYSPSRPIEVWSCFQC